MALAILCSGQGRQHPDMFALTGDAPEAAGLFAHAAELLGGKDPREFVRNDPTEAVHRNRAGQILCTVQALAAAAALRDAMPGRVIVAGYSVGEVAAWGVGGLFSAADTLDLVARRAEAMDAATQPGDGLMFVRGLSREATSTACASVTGPQSLSSIPAMPSFSAEAVRRCRRSRMKRRRCTLRGSLICRSRWPPTPDGS